MKAVGIICEYNPFHNGHLYHMNQIKELFQDYLIVLVVSGPFTERGDVSVLTKWEKTEIALSYGADLVIELPFIFATGSADLFAKGAITILNELQVEYIVFGSEENNIQKLTTLASVQFEEEFQGKVKCLMAKGNNYPTSLSIVLKEMTGLHVSSPNDLLGISYIKEIIRQHSSMKPFSIKRTNQYHSENLNDSIISASAIRKAMKEHKNIEFAVPEKTFQLLHFDIDIELFFPFLKYKIISEKENLNQYHEVSNKLIPRIQKSIMDSNSLDELIHKVKSKNETYNKVKRIFLYILCGLTSSEASFYKNHPYIRILGFNELGQEYLNKIKKKISVPVISNYSNDSENVLALDYRVHQIYTMFFKEEKRKKYLEEEVKRTPIIKNKRRLNCE